MLSQRGGQAGIEGMTSFKHLLRVLSEQVETQADGTPSLKRHTGGKVLVNPSDPDAEAGHKGAGYQVQVAKNKKFTSGKKTKTVKGYSKTSVKVTGLKAKTKYYVRVRTYMKVSGSTYYSNWSGVKSVKVK